MVSPGPATTPGGPTGNGQAQTSIDIRAMNSVRAIREELDRLKDVAVMTPTPENVRRFLDAQQFVMEKGAVFADVARRVVWASPELDYSLRRPTHNAAIQTWKVQRQADEVGAVAAAMRSHGLYFFLRGDCPYCHQLAPVLKYLESAYGVEVFPDQPGWDRASRLSRAPAG
jgi:conjugal transfer pilus assembly protein TraF